MDRRPPYPLLDRRISNVHPISDSSASVPQLTSYAARSAPAASETSPFFKNPARGVSSLAPRALALPGTSRRKIRLAQAPQKSYSLGHRRRQPHRNPTRELTGGSPTSKVLRSTCALSPFSYAVSYQSAIHIGVGVGAPITALLRTCGCSPPAVQTVFTRHEHPPLWVPAIPARQSQPLRENTGSRSKAGFASSAPRRLGSSR